MDKEFVPYEQALELKELGFKEPCFTWYWDDIGLYNGLEYDNHNKREHTVSAPTYQQVFRFFREKYGVHMYPTKFDETKWWIQWGTWTSKVFNTFEEAELECVKKLIELSKNK